jgi:hypothetical protein
VSRYSKHLPFWHGPLLQQLLYVGSQAPPVATQQRPPAHDVPAQQSWLPEHGNAIEQHLPDWHMSPEQQSDDDVQLEPLGGQQTEVFQ